MTQKRSPHQHKHESMREELHELREEVHEASQRKTTVLGRTMEKGDIFKFVGLLAFFALMILTCVLIWPHLSGIFEPGGLDRFIDQVRNAGAVGFLLLLGMQFLQIVVAFIPGEVVQVAAGVLYGPWLGALLILLGCVISSAFIFVLVHKLGAPFVQSIVPAQSLDKFRAFEKTGKLNLIVFILFLIPGLPKDVFTYLVPLTDMKMRTFLLLTTIGRIPGVLMSTYAADKFIDGHYTESIVMFVAVAVIAVLALVFQKRIMAFLGKHSHRRK